MRQDRVVVGTGAGAGIGRAIARRSRRCSGRAHERSPQWRVSKHRGLIAAASASALAGAAGLWAARAER